MIDFIVNITPTIHHWLILSTALFSIGLYGLLSRTNAICILMSIELMLNSTAINLIAFNNYISPNEAQGQIMALFIIAVAAAEAVVALAIFVSLFSRKMSLDVETTDLLKG